MSVSAPPPFVAAMTQFGLDVYQWLGPLAQPDASLGWPLAAWAGGIGEMFREVEETARAQPGREPYQQVFDITRTPDFLLPWFGQWVGVRVVLSADADTQRLQVEAESGFKRGTPAALISAVQGTLTGMQRVQLIERSADAWTMTIITDPTETPDVAATTRAALAAKDAGLILTLIQSSTPFWFQGARTFAAATGTFATATLANVT